MNYHNITTEDMLNGEGLRVVLWVSGCTHRCFNCQNIVTWDPEDGIPFDNAAYEEIYNELTKDYISGLTLSGGDPLHPSNRQEVLFLAQSFKKLFPNKTIWLYTGFNWEAIFDLEIMKYIDVVVDGRYEDVLKEVSYPWAGSTNQRVIDVKKSLYSDDVILYECK